MHRKYKKTVFLPFVIVAMFFSWLIIPTILWFSLYSKPEDSFFSNFRIENLFTMLGHYNDNNFPFRKQIIFLYHGITSRLCFRSTCHIPGNEPDWTFLKRTYPGFTGKNLFSSDEKMKILQKLEKIDSFLSKQGIKFLIIISPDKIQIYPEFLPWIMRRKQAKFSACEDLVQYINARSRITIYYPKAQLLQNKKAGLLYYPNDSHWNMKGAYIAFTQISNFIDEKISISRQDELNWVQKDVSFGDLGLVLPYKISFPLGIRHTFAEDAQHTFDADRRDRRIRNPDAVSKKKILVFHDSFFISMEPYFHHYFQETHQCAFPINYQMINKEMPDVVILQIVERNSKSILNMGIPPDIHCNRK